ncbi:hypothetical protein BKA66DRAFT_192558 [Pyrenochaeta sp. MPI-SDFR-AT-0127]|nr:hypothetical protein BKA66DRAFT_192558 [Pyrenochaeta sp. MPI-SDFR-AT-0127]
MRISSFVAPLFFAATSLAQAVEEGIAPSSGPPDGCQTTVDGTFEIGTLENPTLKHKRETAQEAADGALHCTLKDGILHDQYERTGSVVANRQFQFDGPPQAGAIYTGGFSVCKNGSLAIGGTTRWWRCMSGAFGNLYDEYIGGQCHEIRIQAIFPEKASTSSLSVTPSTILKSEFADATTSLSRTTASASAGLESNSSNSTTQTSGAVSGSASPTGSSPTRSGSGSAASSSPTGAAAAPPASPGSASSSYIAQGVILGAIMAFIGTGLML